MFIVTLLYHERQDKQNLCVLSALTKALKHKGNDIVKTAYNVKIWNKEKGNTADTSRPGT